MNEITVIVIPSPDDNGNSKEPYIKRIEDLYLSFESLLGDSCFDVVRITQLTHDRWLYAYVDDEGKLKGLRANNVFNNFCLDVLGFNPSYTLDGDIILAISDCDGKNVDLVGTPSAFILDILLKRLLDCHRKVQGIPLKASEPEMIFYAF